MKNEEFVRYVSKAEKSLYCVAKSLLKNDEDCADAVQEAVLKAYDKLDTLRQEKYFATWITRILINECYHMLRNRHEEVPYEEYMGNQERTTWHNEVYDALMELEDIYRVPCILYYIEGYSTKEIARILDISVSNVKIRLSRARTKLQELLRGE